MTKKKISELYKKATEGIVGLIKDWHIIDVEYLDGYFIFESGENSVVHFHVKECPNWIFAIWWNFENNKLKGEFFCQYEPTMDKFKPSRSVYNQNFDVIIKDGNIMYDSIYTWGMERVFEYIHKNPIMAWGHDYCYYDYNLQYVSKVEVTWRYMKYKIKDWAKNILVPILDKKFLEFTVKLFVNSIQEDIDERGWIYEIIDNGDHCYPRYDMAVEMPDGYDKEYQDTGCYSMFEKDSREKKLWEKKSDFYHDIASLFKVYWSRSIGDCVNFYNKKEHEAWLKEFDDSVKKKHSKKNKGKKNDCK